MEREIGGITHKWNGFHIHDYQFFYFLCNMKALPDRQIINEALERICSDKLFRRSHTNELILRFLVDQAYEGADVKEQVIGLEIFKKDYSPEQNDSKIRVAVYYLRKKLDAYYAESGKNEEIRFHIEKGQYNLSFKTKKQQRLDTASSDLGYIKIRTPYLVGVVMLVLIVLASFFLFNRNSNLYCWSNFFDTNSSNICVVSDHYVARNTGEKSFRRYSLYSNVKSEEDLIDYNEKNPDDKLALSHFTLFSKMAPFAIQNLTQWFAKYESTFTIRIESEVRYEDFKENNLIFIGQAKNMVISKSIFLKESKKFTYKDQNIVSIIDGVEKIHWSAQDGEIFRDYSIVSFVKTESGNDVLFFVSGHDIGVMSTVKNFTNEQWLKDFNQNLPKGKKYFNALFEVEGVNRTDVVCKLIDMEILQ